MKGLLIKDILNLKKSFSTVVIMIILYFLFAFKSGDPSILVGMIVLLLTMMSITSISYDDLAKWDKFALAMPIKREKIVFSKYILSVLLSLVGVIISTAIGYVIILLKGKMSLSDFLITSYIIFGVSIIFSCIILPLVFKFGVEKGRLMIMAVLAIPMVIAYVLSEVGIPMPTYNQLIILLKVSPLILLAFIYISSSISYNIYRKKDF